jgi:signal transduction histidine kinase/CheY-like chemotaxis protein
VNSVGNTTAVLVLALLAAAPAHAQSLEGPWRFQPGDELRWADPQFDDRGWRSIEVPTGWRPAGYDGPSTPIAWYRTTLRVSPDGEAPLGIAMGAVSSAYELYADGERIGSVGALPPLPRPSWDERRVWALPPHTYADGQVVLAVRVWTIQMDSRTGALVAGPFLAGPLQTLARAQVLGDVPHLLAASVLLLFALVHFMLLGAVREHAWFGLFAVAAAVFVLTRTQLRFDAFPDAFLVIKGIEHGALAVVAVAFGQSLLPFIGRPVTRWWRVYFWFTAAMAATLFLQPLLVHDVYVAARVDATVSRVWHFPTLAYVLALTWAIGRAAWQNVPESRLIALGAVPVVVAGANDIAVVRGVLASTQLMSVSVVFPALAMLVALGHRARRAHRELAVLSRDLERRLDARTRELAEANDAKDRLIAIVSHEIRTPLNGILGVTRLLLQSPLTAAQQEWGHLIQGQGRSLLRVVNDILDVAKFQTRGLEIHAEPVALRELIEDVVRVHREAAAGRPLEFLIAIDERVPASTVTDGVRLRQVIDNLVANAVRFTERGAIAVRVAADAAEFRVRIEDTGPGIPENKRELLFTRFAQLDAAASRTRGGTGLGLHIVGAIVDALGGRVGYEPRPGGGSAFWFAVPLRPVEPPRDPAGAAAPLARTRREGRPLVLLAEDNPVNQLVAVSLLEDAGCQVVACPGGREAIARFAEIRPDLVLLDCQMPEVDGYQAAREMRRAEAGGAHTPIVALTAHAFAGERERCLAAGMDDVLTKPLDPEAVAGVLERWVLEPQPSGGR